MIARHWRGWTTIENAGSYERLLRETVLPELKQIEGYCGGYILRNDHEDEAEFVVVKRFAGPDYAVAVFEPEAIRLLLRKDAVAVHYEVRASNF
jgi:hypothetical protein